MRILVYPHDLHMGGSQINAIELAAEVRSFGHEAFVYGQAGPLCEKVADLGLEFIESPRARRRPTLPIVSQLRRVIRSRGIDVVHGYEWPPILEARLATLGTKTTCVGTVMSMAVAPFIPQDVALVVGTEQIAAAERDAGRRAVAVIEPPVDITENRPDLGLDTDAFREAYDIPAAGVHVVTVTRLARELKLEGLLTAIDVIPRCSEDTILTIVGDGPAASVVAAAAQRANESCGRAAVVLTGEIRDPRPAYAMADVVLGMGGSALRALAFCKPLIVQGEQGFWQALTPESLEEFLWTGWYGVGADPSEGPARLLSAVEPLFASPELRRERGDFGLRLVEERYSLEAAARRQVGIYESALARPRRPSPARATAAAGRFLGYSLRGALSRVKGSVRRDDFNARPVAAMSTAKLPVSGMAPSPLRREGDCPPFEDS